MKFLLNVHIDPDKQYIHVQCKITDSCLNRFYLNENFSILSASSNGTPIHFRMDKTQPHPAFDTVSRPVYFDTDQETIELEYEGRIPDVIGYVNMITANTIELASYSGWFPKPVGLGAPFTFELDLILPPGFEIASNGDCSDPHHIVSGEPVTDIVLFASNKVNRVNVEQGDIPFTFLCPPDLCPAMQKKAEHLFAAHQHFTDIFGTLTSSNAPKTEIVSVFSPRAGGGYKRQNLTVISAEVERRGFYPQGDIHELAHAWWSIADVTKHDWINEGGAEFSSFLLTAKLFGRDFVDDYLEDCMPAIKSALKSSSISATGPESPHRYINHYFKPTVMFINAVICFGLNAVLDLLRRTFQTYQGTRNATTAGFLDLCNPEMRSFFEAYLFAEDWNKLDYTETGSASDFLLKL